jgi:hypothetical protein
VAFGMHVWRFGLRLAYVSLAIGVIGVVSVFTRPAVAQEPNRDERWPCIGMLDLANMEESSSLASFLATAVVDLRAGSMGNDVVRVRWEGVDPAEVRCIWGQVAQPGRDFSAMADFVGTTAAEDDRFATEWAHEPVASSGTAGRPDGGEYCYRLVALTRVGDTALRSPIRETCVQVENPVGPVAPGSGGTPLPPAVGGGQGGEAGLGLGVIALLLIAAGAATFVAPWLRRRS